jgi:methylmalonyl-CoA mutase N-terminal domain/subunit
MPILDKVKKDYEIGRTIVVADKGVNTADNIAFTLARGDGYVYSQTVRGANIEESLRRLIAQVTSGKKNITNVPV